MTKSILITIVALGVLATPCLAKNPRMAEIKKSRQEQRTKKMAPTMTRFNHQSKAQLQEELKQLMNAYPAAMTEMKEIHQEAKSADIAFRHAPENEKYEALLSKLEAEAALGLQRRKCDRAKRDFRAAQKAYKKLLMFEASGIASASSKKAAVEQTGTALEPQTPAPEEVAE